MIPSLTSEKPKTASSDASATSAHATRPEPPPSAYPCTRRAFIAAEHRVRAMLHGALAAALTPLAEDGEALDEAAFEPYVDFLAAGGLDGLLALGTTGEGFLLSPDLRRRAAELFLEAAADRLDVAVHCGAQSTADTLRHDAHAATAGAAAVSVTVPPN